MQPELQREEYKNNIPLNLELLGDMLEGASLYVVESPLRPL